MCETDYIEKYGWNWDMRCIGQAMGVVSKGKYEYKFSYYDWLEAKELMDEVEIKFLLDGRE